MLLKVRSLDSSPKKFPYLSLLGKIYFWVEKYGPGGVGGPVKGAAIVRTGGKDWGRGKRAKILRVDVD